MRDTILSTSLLPDQTTLFYLGQEGFLIKWQNTFILIDGYLTDFVDRTESTEELPWVRRYPAPISPEELDFVDYVFCTHPHGDHADPDTLRGILRVNQKAVFLAPHSLNPLFERLGIPQNRIRFLDGDEHVSLKDSLSVTAVPAAHEELTKDAGGHYESLGYLLKLGPITLYHAGDCCLYDGLTERLNGVDLGLLPINGRDYFRTSSNIIGNMDSVEAIRLAKQCGFRTLIPMHFDLYEVNDVNPAYFVDCLYKINPKQQFHIFAPGERFLYAK